MRILCRGLCADNQQRGCLDTEGKQILRKTEDGEYEDNGGVEKRTGQRKYARLRCETRRGAMREQCDGRLKKSELAEARKDPRRDSDAKSPASRHVVNGSLEEDDAKSPVPRRGVNGGPDAKSVRWI
jgi:hypothetical protein